MCIILHCEKGNSYRDQLSVCWNGQTEINTNTTPREIIWKSGDADVSLCSPLTLTALSISLTAWALAIYFYRSIEYIPESRRFRPGKSGTNREHRERGWKNWANPPGGEKVGVGAPGGISDGREDRVWQKTWGRTREGFNKFLRRSPLSGVNHTIIGRLKDISLSRRGIIERRSVPCNTRECAV